MRANRRVVDTYYLTFEVHFTIEFTDPMESLNAQSNILAVIGQLFPSDRNKSVEVNEGMEGSDATTTADRDDPGKLSRIQLEREIKKLQAVLVTKKQQFSILAACQSISLLPVHSNRPTMRQAA